MSIQVRDETFYHINSNANGSPHRLMYPGDRLSVGAASNPFFAFYEGLARTVTITAPQGPVPVPILNYLRQVKEGTITPSDFAQFKPLAYDIANYFMMLSRELVWENVRLADFPNEPSRQRCIFLVASVEQATHWARRLNFGAHMFRIVKLRATGRVHHVDASLLVADSAPLLEWHERAGKYWRGELSEHPEMETLFDGDIAVDEIIEPPPVAAPT